MQFFDVFTKKVFELNGEKKAKYYRAGFLKITEKGNRYLRLFLLPDVDFYIREREPVIPVVDAEE